MTPEDAAVVAEYSQEFLDAARYGEIADLRLMASHERLRQLIPFSSLSEPESGNTPLMYASANGHTDCVEYLVVEVGCSVGSANKAKNTALHWAALNGHAEIVEFLIARGVDVLVKNEFGRTAFDEALVRDRKDCCEILAREEVRLQMLTEVDVGDEQMDTIEE
jgi:uncharacterized protein